MKELLRALPKVDTLLQARELADLCREYGSGAVADGIRSELDELRQGREPLPVCRLFGHSESITYSRAIPILFASRPKPCYNTSSSNDLSDRQQIVFRNRVR